MTGEIFDQSGAPVAGATVRLVNSEIGFSLSQTTDADGAYTFEDVPPADDYRFTIEKVGFKTYISPEPFSVHVSETRLVRPPIRLELAVEAQPPAAQPAPSRAPTQAPAQAPSQPPTQAPALAPAEVSRPGAKRAASSPSVSLDLVSTTVGGVVDSRTVHTLPLLNRDFIDLALLVPGTSPIQQGAALQGASLVVNGTRANMNNYLLDGTDNNDYTNNQSLPFQIVEAMQEFRVQASTSPAEYGRNGGAQINTISRRGTDSIHGSLFEFNRVNALSANNFFSAFNGGSFDTLALADARFFQRNPLSDPTLAALYNVHNPHLVQNQFGGNVGGPLEKDKLFGFFNWESFRVADPLPVFEQVPGNFIRSQSTCSSFFESACDPAALALYNLYPAPNVPRTAFTDPNFSAFNVGQSVNSTSSDNFLGRIDWITSSNSSMSFKHNIQRINEVQGGAVPGSSAYPGSGTNVNGRNQNFSYNYVQRFTSHKTNELRFGWNRFRLTTMPLDASINPASLGFQNLDFTNRGLPTITIGSGFLGAGSLFSTLGSSFGTPSNRADNVWSLADGLNLVRGRHTWKFGGEFRHIRLNTTNDALGRGFIGFSSGAFVAATGAPDIASIARVSPEFGGGFDRSFSTQSYAAYVQDQWRPWQGFTVNYGLRYEVNTAPVERRDRLVNFYPGLRGGQGGLMRANSTAILDPFGNVLGTAPSPAPRAGFNTDYNGWGPRFGFAWDPWKNGQTVVRGGYAIFFDQQPLEPSVDMLTNPPFVMQDQSLFGLFTLDSTNPTFQFGAPGFFTSNGWFRLPYSITARDPNTRTPYVQQFNLGIERQLGNKAVFEIAYVGSVGHKLPTLRDVSPCNQVLKAQSTFDGSVCIPTITNPQTDPSFLFPSILNQETTANSRYHSLQLRFETRSFHRMQLQAFYQWSKSIDDASTLQPPVFLIQPALADFQSNLRGIKPQEIGGLNSISPALSLQPGFPIITTRLNLPQDSSNLPGERGLSDFDVRSRFVINYIYDVPKWAPGIGSGWELAGITTLQSGQPFTVFENFFGTPLRPNLIGTPVINNANPNAAIDGGNFPCFGGPPPGNCSTTLAVKFDPNSGSFLPGNLGRNTFSGPGLVNFDFSVLKNTHLGSERKNLEFRVEFFNLFNRANFRQPYSQAGELVNCNPFGNCPGFQGSLLTAFDPFFGQILQARPPREVQLALKFSF
ncbi:MAG: carboxypeptidase regulatory-like domain-containing protein [Candidatus Acidiferrales bacterium]